MMFQLAEVASWFVPSVHPAVFFANSVPCLIQHETEEKAIRQCHEEVVSTSALQSPVRLMDNLLERKA